MDKSGGVNGTTLQDVVDLWITWHLSTALWITFWRSFLSQKYPGGPGAGPRAPGLAASAQVVHFKREART